MALRVLRERPDRHRRDGPGAATAAAARAAPGHGALADRRGGGSAARPRGARGAAADHRGDGPAGDPAVVPGAARARARLGFRPVGAPGHAATGRSAARRLPVLAGARLRVGDRARVDVLLRVRGCLAGARALPPGRSRLHPAPVRARCHAVRGRLGGRVHHRRAARRAPGSPGHGDRAVPGAGRVRDARGRRTPHLAGASGRLAVRPAGGRGGRGWRASSRRTSR